MARPAVLLALAGYLVGCSAAEAPPVAATGAAVEATAPLVDLYLVLEGPSAIEAVPPGVRPDSAAATPHVRRRMAELDASRVELTQRVAELGGHVIADIRRLGNLLHVLLPSHREQDAKRLPGVKFVERVPLIEPALASAVPVVGAPAVWGASTSVTGKDVVIGIIDSGIDYTHADFGGLGTTAAFSANDPSVIEPGSFPTAKVVGGWDFAGNQYNPGTGSQVPSPDADPLDCFQQQAMQIAGGHGTHVAGIAAGQGVTQAGAPFTGPYDQSFNPAAFRVGPGVAPEAKLYALKIFGCTGGTMLLASALERAVDPNDDGDLSDRLDVVNASLGTSYGLGSQAAAGLAKNLHAAGSLLVVAAGNDGQSFFAVGAPATLDEPLSVAASTDSQLIGLQVTAPASVAGEYVAAEGGFTARLSDTGPISGPVVATSPANGCGTLANPSALAGKIAIARRGSCPFIQKFNGAIAAGAIAMIIVDNEEDAMPFAMGGGDPGSVSIPGVMVRQNDGELLLAQANNGLAATLDASKPYSGAGAEMIASFSSRGPSAVDGRLKPEISAPGFAIDSARVGSGFLPRRSQGTSMASPMVAGAAALVRQANPSWAPTQVKGALMNSAARIQDGGGNTYPVSIAGAGRVDVGRAVSQTLLAAADDSTGTVAISFGSLVVDETSTLSRTFEVTNTGTDAEALTFAVETTRDLPGVTLAFEPASVALAAGANTTVTFTLSVDPQALGRPGPDPSTPPLQFENARQYLVEASGHVRIDTATETGRARVPYHGSIRAAARRKAAPLDLCSEQTDSTVAIPIEGTSAHPAPVITAFELGAESPAFTSGQGEQSILDLLAVGTATTVATAETFEELTVYFAAVVAGEWITPAQGALSPVIVVVDTNFDTQADFFIRAEPLTRDGPYADVLVSTTYAASGGQPIIRRVLNVAGSDIADTAPFYNNVVVLATFAKDLNLLPGAATFQYSVVTQSNNISLTSDSTDWVVMDAERPRVNTARGGYEGRPLYLEGPVLADIDPELDPSAIPSLLLLHHTNVRGERHEIVELATAVSQSANLKLEGEPPTEVLGGTQFGWSVLVRNTGGRPADSVVLELSLDQATLIEAKPTRGSCSTTNAQCDFGPLAPDEWAIVDLTLTAPPKGSALILRAEVDPALPCELSVSDNVVGGEVKLLHESRELDAIGGCSGCATPRERPTGALLLGLLAVAGLLRRRMTG